jgi:6-phosphogluconolactonase
LFPGTTALDERTRSVAANHVPQLDTWRLTLTYPTLNAASEVIITAPGGEKADALEKVFHGPEGSVPIQGVRPTSGQLVWLLDRKSAAKLRL